MFVQGTAQSVRRIGMGPKVFLFGRRLAADDRGAVAITFALLSVAIMGFVAMGVDWTVATRAKQAMQGRLDQAALASARAYAENSADPQTVASTFFDPDWVKLHLASTPTLNIVTSRDGQSGDHIVQLEAQASMRTSFAKVVGVSQLSINVKSEARVAVPFTEIALALDTTGSMSGAKLDDLKAAARQLVRDVFDIPGANQRVKFSLVPFAQYVNVGLGYRTESWMNVPPDGSYWDANICWDHYPVIGQTNCRQTTCTGYNDGVPFQYNCEMCDYTYGPPQRQCGMNVTTVWNGCAGSRNYPMNMTPIANSGSRIPGVPNVQCGAELKRLTDQESAITAAINNMTAVGDTYIAAGVEWGWRTLSPNGPFAGDTRPTTGSNRARKILVLMTDGSNTRSPNYPDHEGYDASAADTLMSEICTKAKTEGIEIFTVAFEVADNATKTRLLQCAINTSNFYDAQNRSALFDAFQTIAKKMVQTRLSK
jgi:Flp pilus assembly protein TadG